MSGVISVTSRHCLVQIFPLGAQAGTSPSHCSPGSRMPLPQVGFPPEELLLLVDPPVPQSCWEEAHPAEAKSTTAAAGTTKHEINDFFMGGNLAQPGELGQFWAETSSSTRQPRRPPRRTSR